MLPPTRSLLSMSGLFLVAVACSPVVRVRSRIELPAALTAPDPARLHVTTATATSPGALPAPPPGPLPSGALGLEIAPAKGGLESEITLRGTRLYVMITAWYDTNGNGAVDSGDGVGSLGSPVLAEDRGPWAGNVTTTATIPLSLVR